MVPQGYRHLSCVPHSAVTYWLAASDPWPDFAKPGGRHSLIVVQGVAWGGADLEHWKERQRTAPTLPHLLLGLPTQLMPPGMPVPPAQLRKYFAYGNFRWYLGGHPYSFGETQSGRSAMLTRVLASLYPSAPGPFPSGRRPWEQIVRALLFNRGRLKLSTAQLNAPARSQGRFYDSLRRFFVEPGLLVGADTALGWTEFRVSGTGGNAEPEPGAPGGTSSSWLSFLLESLYGKESSQGVRPQDLLEALARPPYGVRGSLARHLVAIAASCHIGSLWFEEGRPGSKAVPVQEDQLLALLERPRGKLVFRPAGPTEQLFLRSLRQLFRPLVEMRGDLTLDPWEQTRKDILQWHAELPSWTRLHRVGHSTQAQALLKVCEEATSCDSHKLLRTVLPEAFRKKEIPLPADQAYFLDQINVARLELEGFIRRFLDKLTLSIHRCLVGGEQSDLADSREWLLRGRRTWLAGFLSGTFEGVAFSPWAEGLLSALQDPSSFGSMEVTSSDWDLEERWFVQLPRDLGLPPVREWETDHSRLFLARLGRARLELELGRFQEFFAAFAGPRKVESLKSWLHLVLTGDDVPSEVAEEILALILDDLE